MVAVHQALHQYQTARFGYVKGRLSIRDIAAERFLAEDVLACVERPTGPFRMHGVRERNVYRLDLVVVEQALIAPVPARYPPLLRVRSRAFDISACNGRDLDEVRLSG